MKLYAPGNATEAPLWNEQIVFGLNYTTSPMKNITFSYFVKTEEEKIKINKKYINNLSGNIISPH